MRTAGVFLALAAVAQQACSLAVPFASNTPDFSVATLSSTVSVVCTATSAVTCQAVRIQDSNQTILGVPKTVNLAEEYLDVEIVAIGEDTLLTCYSTAERGATCVQFRVDPNFGLMGDPVREIDFCAEGELCPFLALERTAVPTSFVICYGLNNENAACSLIENITTAPTIQRLLTMDDTWENPGSLSKVPGGPLVLCVSTLNYGATENGKCLLLNDATLQIIPGSTPFDLGPISIVSAAYVGKIGSSDRLTICYLSTQTTLLYCAAAYILNNRILVSSRDSYAAPYIALSGLKLTPLTASAGNLAAMGCLATIEDGSDQLVCTLINTSSKGVINVDDYEMVVDRDGFYYQNVRQALASVPDVGAYLESSARRDTSIGRPSDVSMISDATVLPNFKDVFTTGATLSMSSVGCVSVGMNDMDDTRFCVATDAKLSRPPPPPPPFPPNSYCNVKLAWECAARKEHCVLVGSTCTSKYACTSQTTVAKCNQVAAAGAQCAVVDGKCTPTFDWAPDTMCQTVVDAKQCGSSPGCVWAAAACRVKPYCQLPTRAQCRQSAGCLWIGRRCGVANLP